MLKLNVESEPRTSSMLRAVINTNDQKYISLTGVIINQYHWRTTPYATHVEPISSQAVAGLGDGRPQEETAILKTLSAQECLVLTLLDT